MSSKLLIERLIKNLDSLFQNPSINYDTVINVGNESNNKRFFAHSLILTSQSIYFKRAFSSDWIKKDGDKIIFEKPNISPKSFEIILKHLYSGDVALDGLTSLELLDLLTAADEFMLTELLNFAESHLLSLADAWIKTDFIKIHLRALQFTECKNLQEFCVQKVLESPELIFKSNDFINLNEDLLIELLKRDDLEMDEIELWKYVIQWGIHKCSNNLIEKNVSEWEEENFIELWDVLKDFIDLIRFYDISRLDLSKEVEPYLPMFPREIREKCEEWGCFTPRVQSKLPKRGKRRNINFDFDEISEIRRCLSLKSDIFLFQNDYILSKFLIRYK